MSRAFGWAVALGLYASAGCGGGSSDLPGDGSGSDPGSGSEPPGPLDPPSDVHAAPGAASNRCVLAWTPPAQGVDGYEITTDAPGWSFDDADSHGGIAPRGAMAVLDFSRAHVTELSKIAIRIRSRNHGAVSAFTPPVTCTLPVRAPEEVVTTIEPDGITVSWFSFSTVATSLEVERAALGAGGAPGAWSSVATLAPDPSRLTQTTLDTAAHPAGTAYAYRVSAIAAGGERGTSVSATSLPLGAALTTSTVMLPPSAITIADRAGHYGMIRGSLFGGPLVITWGDGTTWTSSPSITATAYPPFLKLDALGLPHAVYGKPATAGGGVNLTHGWSDGAAWHEETIATRALTSGSDTPTMAFDLDASGTPVLMWTVAGVNETFEVASKVADRWVVQPLDALTTATVFGNYTMFSDRSGVAHLILATAQGLRHLQLTGGAWSDERIPGFAFRGPLLAAGRDPSHLAVCFDDFAAGFQTQPSCVRKTPAGWTEPEALAALPGGISGGGGVGWIAMSDDGARLAVLRQNTRLQLFRSDAPGAWNELALALIGPGPGEPAQFLAFDATGKLSFLIGPASGADQPTVAYHRSAEP